METRIISLEKNKGFTAQRKRWFGWSYIFIKMEQPINEKSSVWSITTWKTKEDAKEALDEYLKNLFVSKEIKN
jgi:hypothetical protein